MYEQLDIFSLMKSEEKEERLKYPRLKVGDKIGKLILGEVKIATITEVEGVASKEPYGKNKKIRKQAGGYIWKYLDDESEVM